MNRIFLAYCHDNAELAEHVEQNISRIGLPFEHISDHPGETSGSFTARLQNADDPVVLFITDNFFKSRDCMNGALAAVQSLARQQRLLAVVADGKVSKDGGATYEYVETHFDRMVFALHYMNHWQSAWLELSDRHQHAEGEARTALETELDATHHIANEIGELIGVLRDTGYTTWEQFAADDFALFFRQFGLQEWHEPYRQIARTSYIPQDPTPPIPQTAPQTTLAETPVVAGSLIPEPAEIENFASEQHWRLEEEEVATSQDVEAPQPASDGHSSDGLDTTPAEEASEEILTEEPLAISQPEAAWDFEETVFALPEEEEAESENHEAQIEQAIRDAWFWLEKGHTERGLELLQFTLEQFPDNERLKSEYEAASAKYAPQPEPEPQPQQPAPPPGQAPSTPARADSNQQPATDNQQSITSQEAQSYDIMGDMAAEKGDYLFAKYCWDRAAEIAPDYSGLYRKLGLMTAEHLRDYRATAVIYLKKALEQDPNDAEVNLSLAGAYLQNEDSAQAEVHYAQAVMLNPSLRTPENDRLFRPFVAQTPAIEIVEKQPAEIAPVEAIPAPLPVVEKREVLTVLITGATSGIGKATAEVFAQHGHRVIITGRRMERLLLMKTQFEEEYRAEVLMLPFDVRERGAVQAALGNLPESWQNIDILVNNAGLAKGLAPIHEGDIEHWEQMIDTNVKGLLYVTRAIAPGMVARRRGHIINISSSAGKEVYPSGNVYCATKFAVEALTRGMRLDLHKHNVRVSQVSPGHVEETEFAITRFDGDAERARIYDDFQPLKSSDVAEAIYWLATRPPHINVQDIQMYATQQASATVIDRSGR
jgi:NADP-dependent 3-hydroxy acid dehydrogenase YdfG